MRHLFLAVLLALAAVTAQAAPAPVTAAGTAPPVGAVDGPVFTIRQADAWLQPDGGPPWQGVVDLPHRWDRQFPGRGGQARYRLEVPVTAPGLAGALWTGRVGNQVEVRVDGVVVQRAGEAGDTAHDASRRPLWVPLPPAPAGHGTRQVEVNVVVQGGRWGGLGLVHGGPADRVRTDYERHYAWRVHGSALAAFGLLLCAGLLAGFWWVSRDRLFRFMAAGCLAGVVVYANRIWTPPPLPWPLWGGVVVACIQVHLLYLYRAVLGELGLRAPWLDPAARGLLGLCVAVPPLAYAVHRADWAMAWVLATLPVTLAVLACAIWRVWSAPTRQALVLLAALGLGVAAIAWELVAVRWLGDGMATLSVSVLATLGACLVMTQVAVGRYASQFRAYQSLARSLDERLQQREGELRQSLEQLRTEHAESAVLQERQRIMRDIHDGVGAQLVGLMSLLGQAGTARAVLQEQVQLAMDELRMAVDALQPVHDDLPTVLGTLRYRLQPRLQAAGVQLTWDMAPMPPLAGLTPQRVLQLQRLLLEAFTNVIRHASARRLLVQARWHPPPGPGLVLVVEDDGRGLDPARAAAGQGLASMRSRAAALDGQLTLGPGVMGGTRLQLTVPLRALDPELGS